jgi:hypothetical protein
MEKTGYKKTGYLYGDYEFFLYAPIKLDIFHEEYDKQGEATKIMHGLAGNICSYPVRTSSYTIVESFIPDGKNRLLADYRGVFVPCINDNAPYYPKTLHSKCSVLTDKHGGYTQLQCECCGQTGLIAINSWRIATESDLKQSKCNEKISKQ